MEWHQLALFWSTAIGIPLLLFWLCGERSRRRARQPFWGVLEELSDRVAVSVDEEAPSPSGLRSFPPESRGRTTSKRPDSPEDWEHRMTDQLDTLDRLIEEADDEIARLEQALTESARSGRHLEPLTARQEQQCYELHESGLDPWAIARKLKVNPLAVEAVLDQWSDAPGRRAA